MTLNPVTIAEPGTKKNARSATIRWKKGVRSFIEANICNLEKYTVALDVVGPKFNKEDFQEAAVRERMDELTPGRGEEGVRTFVDLQVHGHTHGSQRSPPECESQGQDLVENMRGY